jgi:3-oxoadipate enol-lactonase
MRCWPSWATGLERATLFGASRGGGIALDAVLEHPNQFTGLVTAGSSPNGFPEATLNPPEQMISDLLDDLLSRGRHVAFNRLEAELWSAGTTRNLQDLDAEFLETSHALNTETLSHLDDASTHTPVQQPASGRTADITVPSLFVIGDHDLSPKLALTTYILETRPNATEVRFAGAAHSPTIECPAEFTECCASGTTKISRRRRPGPLSSPDGSESPKWVQPVVGPGGFSIP